MEFNFKCPSCGGQLYLYGNDCRSCNFTYKDWPSYNKKEEETVEELDFANDIV